MSTQAAIILKQPGVDNWASISVHHDGYISHLGEMLFHHYNTYEKVLELIRMGDADCLYEKLHGSCGTTFLGEQKSYFFHRDGDDELCVLVSDTFTHHTRYEYNYLFEPERDYWTVKIWSKDWVLLSEVV